MASKIGHILRRNWTFAAQEITFKYDINVG